MELLNERKIEIEPGLKRMILIELVLPTALLVIGIYHGLMQVLYRAGHIHTRKVLGLEYYQGLTLHGVVNAIVFTTFFAVAFGYAVIRFYLGRVNMKIAWLSFTLMIVGTLLAAGAILSGTSSVLYTFYPPLRAHPAFYIGLTLVVVGSWIAFFNWLPVYFSWKREHPGEKVPLAVVGIFAAFIVWLIATIPVAIEIIFMLIPWSFGWVATVNVPLARMLFWFFGHPLVYFWLLPTYVMYYTMLPKVSGGKLFSDFAGRLTFMWLILYSAPVGIHHQFTEPGISSTWKFVHAFFTMLVAVPSFATAFVMAASMELGARERGGNGLMGWWKKLPYLDTQRWLFGYFFCGLFIFIFGGVTGIINASYNLDIVVHNTSWLPAHFHQTVAGPVFLSYIGMTLFLVARLTGKEIKLPRMNVWVPYIWTLGIMIFSTGLFISGASGEPRRTNMGLTYANPDSPLYHADWQTPRMLGVLGGTIMTIAALMFFIVFFATLFARSTRQGALELVVSEPYHDENVRAVQSFTPWLVGAALLLVIAYTPPIVQTLRSNFPGAPPYTPDRPTPINTSNP
ncbi:MAG TPA: cbb3-type cytochrome c oxidase subunit I [Chthoniobacterales bacterium]|jgi:Heme/copper-type cytochrome/quinol oxidases, subunit 1|nr:cbb3-type cytochrome c oxidase subunit I [Chthoniobacterales bacterium]